MKNFHSLELQTNSSIEFIDITQEVREYIKKSEINDGIILIFTPHTTAGITINENADPSVKHDLKEFIKRKIPHETYFQHSEGNSPSHIMSSLFSASETIIIENMQLILGTWQGIFFCEFDGPRQRRVYLKVI